jgi:DNA-binding response OmpR family regulator
MANPKALLLASSDAILRAALAEQFQDGGSFTVAEAAGAAQAERLAVEGVYDFLVIDATLDGGKGIDVCQGLRAAGISEPVLLLAESDKEAMAGLEAGASDALVKPFRFGVLMARAHAQMRSHAPEDEPGVRIGPYIFRRHAKLLSEGDRHIRLTEKETDILVYLHRTGAAVSRETLLNEVWNYNPAVTTHTLETHIYRLRQKIEADPGKARILITEDGGYRLIG